VLASARTFESKLALTLAVRLPARLIDNGDKLSTRADIWRDTHIRIPTVLRGATCSSVLQRDQKIVLQATLSVADMFDALPIGLFISRG
jgi:maltooligosyltrehalose synthase